MAREKIIPFLKKLKTNNNKEWFDKNRSEYETAKQALIDLVADVVKKLSKTDPSIESTEAKKAIFRINRDIRFSKIKVPYKTNMGASISDGGKKSPKAGYYLHIEPGNCFLAGGVWQPEAENLKKIRQEVDYNGKDLEKIIKTKEFKTLFGELSDEDKLIRVPKDFDADHKYAEYLKLKSFIAVHSFSDKLVTDPKFAEYCTKVFKGMSPLNKFLNIAFD